MAATEFGAIIAFWQETDVLAASGEFGFWNGELPLLGVGHDLCAGEFA
jgi:hypothetical protein